MFFYLFFLLLLLFSKGWFLLATESESYLKPSRKSAYYLVKIKNDDHYDWPARTSVSPCSSSPGTFREEERRSSTRDVSTGEERGETDVFAGYIMIRLSESEAEAEG